jgi:hypothetical protein
MTHKNYIGPPEYGGKARELDDRLLCSSLLSGNFPLNASAKL